MDRRGRDWWSGARPGGRGCAAADEGPQARGETPLAWTADGQWYLGTLGPAVSRIDIVNPLTGARKSWRELHPPRMAGVRPTAPLIMPDGRLYAYGFGLNFSDLFVVSGVR